MRRSFKLVLVSAALASAGAAQAWAEQGDSYQSAFDSVQRDAQISTQMLAAGGGGTGHGAIAPGLPPYGFSIAAGDYSLNIAPAIQFRGAANYGEDRKGGDGSFDTGFEITRARLGVMGLAGSPKLHYYVSWEAGDITGSVELLDLIISYRLNDQLTFRAGQIKAAFAHETAVDAFELLGATRSLVNGLIGIPDGLAGRTQGAGFWYGGDNDAIHAIVLLHDGAGSVNSSFQDGGINWAVGAAVAYTVMGDWKDYWNFSARNTTKDLLVLSAGGDITQANNFNLVLFMLEAQYETASRLALYAAFNGMYLDFRNIPADDQFNWGAHVHAGYALTKKLEVFGRYSLVKYESDTAIGEDTFHEITVGANCYLGEDGSAGSGAKMTVELTWLPSGSPVQLPYYQVLGGTDGNEVVLRAQIQLRP